MMMISNKPLFHLETFRFRIPRMLSKEMRNMDITAFLNAEINTDVLPDYTRFDRSKLFFIESENSDALHFHQSHQSYVFYRQRKKNF